MKYKCRHWKSKDQQDKEVCSDPKQRKKTSLPAYECPGYLSIIQRHVCVCSNPSNECAELKTIFQVKGCVAHSHQPELRFHRVSRISKEYLISLLTIGVPKKDIIARYCTPESYDHLDYKIVTLKDLTNFERLYVKKGQIDLNKTEVENVCNLLQKEEYRGISFEGLNQTNIPDSIKDKVLPVTGKTCIIYASNWMISQYCKFPTTIFMDATHNTNRSKLLLISFLVSGINKSTNLKNMSYLISTSLF